MNAVFTILTILIVIASILLILVVLLQNGKGEGLASNFTAGNQTLGVRQTANLLEKLTWVLVAFILVASIIASFTIGSSLSKSSAIGNKMEQTAEPVDQAIDFSKAIDADAALQAPETASQDAPETTAENPEK